MEQTLTLVERPDPNQSFDAYIDGLLCPLWSLAEVLDFNAGQNASVIQLLEVVNRDLEAKLHGLAEAITTAYGAQALRESADGAVTIVREVAHG